MLTAKVIVLALGASAMGLALPPEFPQVEFGVRLVTDAATGAVTMEAHITPGDAATAHNDLLLERGPVQSGTGVPRYALLSFAAVRDEQLPQTEGEIVPHPLGEMGDPTRSRPKWWWEYIRGRWPMQFTQRVVAGSGATTIIIEHRPTLDRVYLVRSAGDNPNSTVRLWTIPRAGGVSQSIVLPPPASPRDSDWYIDVDATGAFGAPTQVPPAPAPPATPTAERAFLDAATAHATTRGLVAAFPRH